MLTLAFLPGCIARVAPVVQEPFEPSPLLFILACCGPTGTMLVVTANPRSP